MKDLKIWHTFVDFFRYDNSVNSLHLIAMTHGMLVYVHLLNKRFCELNFSEFSSNWFAKRRARTLLTDIIWGLGQMVGP